VLSVDQLRDFGRDGYLVVPRVVGETVLAEVATEVSALIDQDPPDVDKVVGSTQSRT
jgi:hypothetical protein